MNQINDPRLLPCPFCGEDAAIWYYPIDGLRNHESYYVACTNDNCGCELEHPGGYRTLEEALDKWNRRARNEKISEIITDKYKLRLSPTVYYDLKADIVNCSEIPTSSTTKNVSSELDKNSKKLDGESDCISRADAIRVASGYCHPSNVAKELAKLPTVTPQEPRKGYLSIDDVMSVFDDFMCGEVDEDGTEIFLEMLKDKAESEK